MSALIIVGLIALIAIVFVCNGLKIIRQGETKVIERLGKYHSTLPSGINVIWPIIDRPRKVYTRYVVSGMRGQAVTVIRMSDVIDLREQVYDFPEQSVLTKDNATTHIKHLGNTNVFNGKGLELARFVAPRIQIPATAPIYQPQGADLTTRFGAPRAREIRDAQTTALRQSRSYDAEVRRVNFRHGRHNHLHALKEFLGLDQLAGKHRQQARTKCLHVSRQNGLRIVFNSAEKLNDG